MVISTSLYFMTARINSMNIKTKTVTKMTPPEVPQLHFLFKSEKKNFQDFQMKYNTGV